MSLKPKPRPKLSKTKIKEAVDRFKALTVKHDLQSTMADLVMFMLDLSPNCDIVNLVGATGIGKSFLQGMIVETIMSESIEQMQADPSYVPVIRTHAIAAGHRQFSWKTLYRSALKDIGDVFADQRKARPKSGLSLLMGETPAVAELRECLETEFKRRGTRVWIIDEAQHMVFGGKSGQPGDQFDVLKSIAQSSGVKLLLAGPCEMEEGLGSSAQLARRSITLHYQRYLHHDEKHLKQFGGVVVAMFDNMHVAGYPAICDNLVFFYSGCAGCVGILKDWLAKAYGLALREASEVSEVIVTMDHLRAARLSKQAMEMVMDAIWTAEEALQNPATDDDYADLVTGVRPQVKKAKGRAKEKANGAKAASPKRNSKHKPGTRVPGLRDKVGETLAGPNQPHIAVEDVQ